MRRLHDEALPSTERVELSLDGQPVDARAGEPVASALIAAGEWVLGRGVKYHRPRAAFCMQGSCGACLVRIDGRPNMRACMTPAVQGMKIERQNAYPSAALDVFGATDFFFPRGMDHHTFFTGAPRPVHAIMQKVARQLAGLGKLPDERPLETPPAQIVSTEVAVVGGGPAGLRAATTAARGGCKVVLFEEQPRAGGSLLCDPRHGPAEAERLVEEARRAGVDLRTGATALAYYPEDTVPGGDRAGLMAVATARGLLLVTAERTLYATGSYDQNALFPDNDRPGILSARAVGRLLVRDRVLPGKRVVVLGAGPYARALEEALARAGAAVMRIDGVEESVVGTHGRGHVRRVEVRGRDGKTRKVACDLLAIAALPAPATELAREHGAEVRWEASVGGFHVVTDGSGRTRVPGVWAAGDVAGFLGAPAALATGERIGAAIAAERGAR